MIVEADDEIGADALEERAVLDGTQQRDALAFPTDIDIGDAMCRLRVRVERRDAAFEFGQSRRVLGRLFVVAFDSDRVEFVGQPIVRINVARQLDRACAPFPVSEP